MDRAWVEKWLAVLRKRSATEASEVREILRGILPDYAPTAGSEASRNRSDTVAAETEPPMAVGSVHRTGTPQADDPRTKLDAWEVA